MKSDLDEFSDENDPDSFADESNGNSGGSLDNSIDEVTIQERIMSPSSASKLLNLLDPQISEGMATPSRTTPPLNSIVEEPVSYSSQLSSSL